MAFLQFLYASTAFIGLVSFMPQMLKLLKDSSGAESISIVTLALWVLTSNISLAYALVINGDMLFIFGATVFAVGNSTTLLLAVYNRYFKTAKAPSLRN